MRRDWRPGAQGNWGLWDEGGVRDIEGSGENVLIWSGKWVSRRLDQESCRAPFVRTNQQRSYG